MWKSWHVYPLLMALTTGSLFMEKILAMSKNDEKGFSLFKERNDL